MAGEIRWVNDTLTANLAGAQDRFVRLTTKATEYSSLRIERYAKTKAPWTDRTGNARSTLSGFYDVNVSSNSATFTVTISHGMPYGIWLEVRFGQKFAIINKSIQSEGRKFFDSATAIFDKVFQEEGG